MLSIEEIKLLIEKLEKAKGHDFQKLIDDNLKVLKEIAIVVDANNSTQINRINKSLDWYRQDESQKHTANKDINLENDLLFNAVNIKINNIRKLMPLSDQLNSLEIGPGYGKFSRCFLAWRLNYFIDILAESGSKIRKKFNPAHHQYLKFYQTDKTSCGDIPDNSISFVFSWDTFVFFTIEHIKEYLLDIYRTLLPGGYAFIHYANCEYDYDLAEAKKGYWNYNTKTAMSTIIKDTGYTVLEMDQFKSGANYALFQKPAKKNIIKHKIIK